MKIGICGDLLETRCHLEIRVFFSSWERWLFEEFWRFPTHENGAVLGSICTRLGALRIGWWDRSGKLWSAKDDTIPFKTSSLF